MSPTELVQIGFLIFNDVQLLDLAGPYDVLSSYPQAVCHLVASTRAPVRSSTGMRITPDSTFESCPALDVLVVPGGIGVDAILGDVDTLNFVRKQAESAKYITSVCTGSLLLGVAGLLRGKKATSHWAFLPALEETGAVLTPGRVVVDEVEGKYKLITGGGVTAGIDFAITILAELAGEEFAKQKQLYIEYAPQPPFKTGSPDEAPPEMVAQVRKNTAEALKRRVQSVKDGLKVAESLS